MPSFPAKVNILLVDDQQRNLDALSLVLEREDYHLVQAQSGAEAIHHLQQLDFAVVLLDVMMPEMDGFECAKRMRADSACYNTPIIFVSAVAEEMNFIFKGYSSGAVDYIVKPIDPAIVKAKVAIFVELFRAMQVLRVQLAESQALCARLESENSAGKRTYDSLVSQVRDFTVAFEERLKPGSDEARAWPTILGT